MTPEDEARVRELPNLIANEKDREKVITLAAELEFILGKPRLVNQKPQSTSKQFRQTLYSLARIVV